MNANNIKADTLFITIVGVICGADGREAIEEVGKNKLKLLKKHGDFHYGIPVHDTIACIISAIEPSQLQDCFISWMKDAEMSTKAKLLLLTVKLLGVVMIKKKS